MTLPGAHPIPRARKRERRRNYGLERGGGGGGNGTHIPSRKQCPSGGELAADAVSPPLSPGG